MILGKALLGLMTISNNSARSDRNDGRNRRI